MRWRRQSTLGLVDARARRSQVPVEPSDPKPTEAQQRIKTQNGKKSDQADRVGVDLASSKRGSIAQPLPNLTALAETNGSCQT